MLTKRIFDFCCSLAGLTLLAPAFLAAALLIKLDSPGPVFFRQERVGRHGVPFRIFKFRTMRAGAGGSQITVGDDARITRVGRVLRRFKLDELPQLLNVLRGEMSLVGPRPEVPRYVACYPVKARKIVFSVMPGITDWASLKYKDESVLLARAADPERAYIEEILPVKMGYYVRYVQERSLLSDVKIIFLTLLAIGTRHTGPEPGSRHYRTAEETE